MSISKALSCPATTIDPLDQLPAGIKNIIGEYVAPDLFEQAGYQIEAVPHFFRRGVKNAREQDALILSDCTLTTADFEKYDRTYTHLLFVDLCGATVDGDPYFSRETIGKRLSKHPLVLIKLSSRTELVKRYVLDKVSSQSVPLLKAVVESQNQGCGERVRKAASSLIKFVFGGVQSASSIQTAPLLPSLSSPFELYRDRIAHDDFTWFPRYDELRTYDQLGEAYWNLGNRFLALKKAIKVISCSLQPTEPQISDVARECVLFIENFLSNFENISIMIADSHLSTKPQALNPFISQELFNAIKQRDEVYDHASLASSYFSQGKFTEILLMIQNISHAGVPHEKWSKLGQLLEYLQKSYMQIAEVVGILHIFSYWSQFVDALISHSQNQPFTTKIVQILQSLHLDFSSPKASNQSCLQLLQKISTVLESISHWLVLFSSEKLQEFPRRQDRVEYLIQFPLSMLQGQVQEGIQFFTNAVVNGSQG